MKKIIHTRADGGLSVIHPVEGARFATCVTLQSGSVLEILRLVKPAEIIEPAVFEKLTEDEAKFRKPALLKEAVYSKPVYEREAHPVDVFLRRWPVEGAVANWAETEDEFVARIAFKDVPQGIEYQIVDASTIPADRTFRDAWEAGNKCVEHNMVKCREIHKNNLRALRVPKLAALDVEILKASRAKDAVRVAEVEAMYRPLLDAPDFPAISTARTPDELKAAVPGCLK